MLHVFQDQELNYERALFSPPSTPITVELNCNVYNGTDSLDVNYYNIVTEDEIY